MDNQTRISVGLGIAASVALYFLPDAPNLIKVILWMLIILTTTWSLWPFIMFVFVKCKALPKYKLAFFITSLVVIIFVCLGVYKFNSEPTPAKIPDSKIPEIVQSKLDLPVRTAYFDCVTDSWDRAEKETGTLSVVVHKWDGQDVFAAISRGGKNSYGIGKESHRNEFSSSNPIKCEITFNGDKPIFNAKIFLSVQIKKLFKEVSRISETGEPLTVDASFTINQIYPSKNVFSFYVYAENLDASLSVIKPSIFTFTTEDGSKKGSGNFITPDFPFWSVFPKSKSDN
jgi:hypothetical protein